MNKFDEMRAAVSEAEITMRAADDVAHSMALMLRGRLSKVKPYILVQLKRELSRFDAHKKEWKP
jgi:hypothetical protein